MDLLGDSDSEDGGELEFKINKKYAKGYNVWRSKEEKQKLLDKYGEVEDSDSSSSEEEVRSSKQMDKDWLRAFAIVRFQQPRLYKEGERFFHDEAQPVSKKKEKATTLKDHERKFILEKGGIESDEEPDQKPKGKSYFEEQEEIKKSFKDAVGDSSSDEEDDGLLIKRQKTKEEQTKEDNEYLEWLKGEREDLEDEEAAKELAPLKAYWNDPNLSEKERVLRDYVLNNGYMDQEESDDSDEESEGPDRDEEEEFLEKAEQYEHKYNFRHEEPGADEIKSYPRVIEESVRTKDTRRIEQRKRRMEKKNMEKQQRQEEIRLLQKLHKEERKEKLDKLRNVSNNPSLAYDLDADFDPEEHDKIMQNYFGTDYYGDAEDDEKPKFEYDAAVDGDDPDDWWSERMREEEGVSGEQMNHGAPDEEEDYYDGETNFNMDADYDPNEAVEKKKGKKKWKEKKSKKKLPLFDPKTKTFDEYIDEYLKDKIGVLPFTYREVMPNDFGLTTEEILKAPERELNTWVGVKKMSQYRSREEELADKRKFNARARQPGKKMKLIPSLFKKPDEESAQKKKKKKRNAESSKDSEDEASGQDSDSSVGEDKGSSEEDKNDMEASTSKKKKKNKKIKVDSVKKGKKLGALESTVAKKSKKKAVGKKINSPEKKFSKDSQQRKVSPEGKKRKRDESFSKSDSSTGSPQKKKRKFQNESDHIHKKSDSDRKKKKKKLKESAEEGSSKVMKSVDRKKSGIKKKSSVTDTSDKSTDGKVVKKKKRKIKSINNFSKVSSSVGDKSDKKKLQHALSQVMSASRLSKYGIGPEAQKSAKKRKKKKNPKKVDSS